MERYKRAFRDPNSPLTPLTPLSNNNVFNFNIGDANQELVPFNQPLSSPISAGIAVLGKLFNRERGYRLGTADPTSNGDRRRTQSYSGKENSPMSILSGNNNRPIPPLRQKRKSNEPFAIKQERNENLPQINIIPPLRRKRSTLSLQLKDSEDKTDIDVEELSENQDFIRQQQQQLQQYQTRKKSRFDSSNIRLASPVVPKPLSPRLGAFLASWGMNCLKSIFERQEIDIDTFCCLTADDLELLGIEDRGKQELVLKAVEFLKNNLKRE